MNRKWLPYLLIIVLGIAVFFINRWKKGPEGTRSAKTNQRKDPGTERGRGFDRRISYIEYTEHARCRMSCRHISQAEVEEIMRDGDINYKKSDLNANPCPAYALEGVTKDNQRVRIVFGQCSQTTKVITVIDLDTDWSCDCRGDDDKYKNKR